MQAADAAEACRAGWTMMGPAHTSAPRSSLQLRPIGSHAAPPSLACQLAWPGCPSQPSSLQLCSWLMLVASQHRQPQQAQMQAGLMQRLRLRWRTS